MSLKMKIELIKKKYPENISKFDEYLKYVCCEIKDFNGITDLIFSKIFRLDYGNQSII